MNVIGQYRRIFRLSCSSFKSMLWYYFCSH